MACVFIVVAHELLLDLADEIQCPRTVAGADGGFELARAVQQWPAWELGSVELLFSNAACRACSRR